VILGMQPFDVLCKVFAKGSGLNSDLSSDLSSLAIGSEICQHIKLIHSCKMDQNSEDNQ
jgi:hypothetical protein